MSSLSGGKMRKMILLAFLSLSLLGICEEPFLKRAEWQKAVQTSEDQTRLDFFRSLYEKTQDGCKPLGEIPKVFHVIWLGAQVLPEHSVAALKTWMDKHPGWEMKVWTDRDCIVPISSVQVCTADTFPLHACADCYYSAESFEERSVILRYAVLLSEGGIYIDHDAECLVSLEPIRKSHDFFCGLEEPGPSIRSSSINPSCHLIAATAQHPILESATQWIIANWEIYESLFPGSDPLSVSNRMVHRSVHALSTAIENGAALDGRKDSVFPPEYFCSFAKNTGQYVLLAPKSLFGQRRQQAQNKEKMEEAFSSIRTQLRICLYLIFALAALNLFLGAVIYHLYRKRKGK